MALAMFPGCLVTYLVPVDLLSLKTKREVLLHTDIHVCNVLISGDQVEKQNIPFSSARPN